MILYRGVLEWQPMSGWRGLNRDKGCKSGHSRMVEVLPSSVGFMDVTGKIHLRVKPQSTVGTQHRTSFRIAWS